MTKTIIALHGFLGSPADFTPLQLSSLIAPPIFSSSICPLDQWANRFNHQLTKRSILMGYSMGGRLALHCLKNNQHLFKAAIIIAAHPGLKKSKEREARLLYDYCWAQKFLTEPWSQLMHQWNNTVALKSSQKAARNEGDFSRRILASCLKHFSLGHQEYLVPMINELDIPILWLASAQERDRSSDILLKHSQSQTIFFEQGGHRFMFESSLSVKNRIDHFLDLTH